MKPQRPLTIVTIALFAVCAVSAETVYKSIDALGRVTYSSSPPATAPEKMIEKVRIEPGPTEQQKQDAAQRAKALEASTRRAEQERQKQKTQTSEATSDADLALRKAQIALEEAQIMGDDDWQYIAAGGRVPKQSYVDRVEAAKQRVRQAESAARTARSGRR